MGKIKTVKDLMVPLADYATVKESDTLLDAFLALDKTKRTMKKGQYFHRAVLVLDKKGNVVGKIGHLAFLKALEPKYNILGDIELISKSRVSPLVIDGMIEDLNLWQDDLFDICKRAKNLKVKKVMHPVSENIEESAVLSEVLHKIVMSQTASLIVTKNGVVTGIVRVSDLFSEISRLMKKVASNGS